MNLPYTFEPLFEYLEQLDMTPEDLVSQKFLSAETLKKIVNGEPVQLSTAAALCITLGCELPDIVALNFAYNPAALNAATEELKPVKPKAPAKKDRVGYHPWTKEEEAQLIAEFKSNEKLSEIAKKHNRTKGGIVTRINRLLADGEINAVDSAWLSARIIPPNTPEAPRDVISISEIARKISERTQTMLRYEDIASWLVSVNDLDEYTEDGKIFRIPTQQGEAHGIKRGKRKNSSGIEYVGVYLEPVAQRYITENLPLIIEHTNQKRKEKIY